MLLVRMYTFQPIRMLILKYPITVCGSYKIWKVVEGYPSSIFLTLLSMSSRSLIIKSHNALTSILIIISKYIIWYSSVQYIIHKVHAYNFRITFLKFVSGGRISKLKLYQNWNVIDFVYKLSLKFLLKLVF